MPPQHFSSAAQRQQGFCKGDQVMPHESLQSKMQVGKKIISVGDEVSLTL